MSTLAALQRDFLAALFDDSDAARDGIAVYRRNVLANLHDALAATFPVVRRLVGEAFFREAARHYALEYPSRSGDLHEYGDAFAEFLAAYPHARTLPYLADVARLEWACHECAHAADTAAFDFSALAIVAARDRAEIRFTLHPAVRLVRSVYPVAAIREANRGEGDGRVAREGPDFVVVMRERGEARVTRIDSREWDFLAALSGGASLDEASAPFAQFEDEALTLALTRQVQRGVIAGFTLAAGRA